LDVDNGFVKLFWFCNLVNTTDGFFNILWREREREREREVIL